MVNVTQLPRLVYNIGYQCFTNHSPTKHHRNTNHGILMFFPVFGCNLSAKVYAGENPYKNGDFLVGF